MCSNMQTYAFGINFILAPVVYVLPKVYDAKGIFLVKLSMGLLLHLKLKMSFSRETEIGMRSILQKLSDNEIKMFYGIITCYNDGLTGTF